MTEELIVFQIPETLVITKSMVEIAFGVYCGIGLEAAVANELREPKPFSDLISYVFTGIWTFLWLPMMLVMSLEEEPAVSFSDLFALGDVGDE